ncbi:MAG: hypothetical protein IT444_07750 [Phycisphaeraceae bacterium]|nr:hypothetical protein [Phycisphaeraceae bacterium]
MNSLAILIILTFFESLVTVLVERGVYFYSQAQLGFNDVQNLWLALGNGVFYVLGAMSVHRLTHKYAEKTLLTGILVGHIICHLSLTATIYMPVFLASNFLLFYVTGAKWPLIESYVSAGRDARQTADAVGKFNVSWALSVPMAMWIAGPLIGWKTWHTWTGLPSGGSVFLLAVLVNCVSIAMLMPLESRPQHLPHDHQARPGQDEIRRLRLLTLSSRWSMLASYILLFLIVPLWPSIFESLGFKVAVATTLASFVDIVRAISFFGLQRTPRWHGRTDVLVYAAVGLPVGFCLMLFGKNLPAIIVGQVIFGLAAGMAYYAALYYAMVVANASVESGSAHESLVGSGFAIGPAFGLIGAWLGHFTGGTTSGMAVSVVPLLLLCLVGALWPIRKIITSCGSKQNLPIPPAG